MPRSGIKRKVCTDEFDIANAAAAEFHVAFKLVSAEGCRARCAG